MTSNPTESDWMESVDMSGWKEYAHDPYMTSFQYDKKRSHWTKYCPKVKRSKRRKDKMRQKRVQRNRFCKK